MSAATEGAIDVHAVRLDGERIDRLAQEHGDVRCWRFGMRRREIIHATGG
jgi:hypothetical protein